MIPKTFKLGLELRLCFCLITKHPNSATEATIDHRGMVVCEASCRSSLTSCGETKARRNSGLIGQDHSPKPQSKEGGVQQTSFA